MKMVFGFRSPFGLGSKKILFNGDDVRIETGRKDPTTGSLKKEARVSSTKKRDSIRASTTIADIYPPLASLPAAGRFILTL